MVNVAMIVSMYPKHVRPRNPDSLCLRVNFGHTSQTSSSHVLSFTKPTFIPIFLSIDFSRWDVFIVTRRAGGL